MENPIKMDDLGVPIIYGNTHLEIQNFIAQTWICIRCLEIVPKILSQMLV